MKTPSHEGVFFYPRVLVGGGRYLVFLYRAVSRGEFLLGLLKMSVAGYSLGTSNKERE